MELKKNYNELVREVENLEKENSLLKTERDKTWEKIKFIIANISHELKTPLNSIIGFSELMNYKSDDEKIVKYSKNILNSSKHMLSLVQNISDITKSQYKPIELNYDIFRTKDVIDEVIESFNKYKINSALIDVTIFADHTRFKQLVFNLISNAVKYNTEGQAVDILTYIENNNFCFEITDYGEGIEKDDLKKIFDFYAQFSKDRAKRQLGSGIGLSLCKIIAEAHGGKIEVISKKDFGSTFSFSIPLEKP